MPAQPDEEWPARPTPTQGSTTTTMRIDHIQLLMPEGGEGRARSFFRDLLGMMEEPVPEKLRPRAACWFRDGPCSIHVGIEDDFQPQPRAHPALSVPDLGALADRLAAADHDVVWDDRIPGVRRFHTFDPFGNRIEFVDETDALSRPYE